MEAKLLPSTLWQKELAEASANRRATLIKLAFPTVIVASFLLIAPPGFYVATVITVLAAITGCFGTGITLSKARGEGMLQRIALTPLSRRRIALEQLAVNSAVDLCQFLPLALLLAVRFGVYDSRLVVLLLALGASIATANLLGLLMNLFASSPAEVMLYSTFAIFPLLYLAGAFSPVGSGADLRALVAASVPFFYLQQSLLSIVGEGPVWSALTLGSFSLLAGFVVSLVAVLLAPRAVRTEQ